MGINQNLVLKSSNMPPHQIDMVDPSNAVLLQALEDYATAAYRLGYFNPIFSKKSLAQLNVISVEKKQEIASFLRLCIEWFSQCEFEQMKENETPFLLVALERYGLEVDEELLATIDHDTVIEVYSENMVQLFRSFGLLKLTGYSIMDLSVFEWYMLWERPSLVIEQMQADIGFVMRNEIPFKRFDVVRHILKETFDTGLTEPFVPRAGFVDFQYIGCLKRKTPTAPRAFICTGKGSVIAEGLAEAEHLAFL
ncbi:MAG: hypothetical protein AB7O96_09300 [Pseudobdellovibrionaceae bacterium]